jgi:hypothetical protein
VGMEMAISFFQGWDIVKTAAKFSNHLESQSIGIRF